jgi:uncharacterized protein YndB with AHSA1/START domain
MQLTAREDIEAPLDRVFAALSDFETVERQALRRGLDVQRAEGTPPDPGTRWLASFGFRGKQRSAEITLKDYTPPEKMVFESVSGGLTVIMVMEVMALSRTRTRIAVEVVMEPKTLSARLLVQSLKLAKGGIDKRFRHRMHELARDLENRLQKG